LGQRPAAILDLPSPGDNRAALKSGAGRNPNIRKTPSSISHCFELHYGAMTDHRGNFVKTFHESTFRDLGLETKFIETFYSVSGARVLRGMHIQCPPSSGVKLVYCLSGRIMDVALDLRCDSPTFGRHDVFELSADRASAVYLAKGVGHGFYVLEAPALVVYHSSSEYNPKADSGIRWDSFGFRWPDTAPVLSARDSELPSFDEFRSPFSLRSQESQAR
jgi:dTDP-4-dehydrorhamnose 3,5-epimerase